MTMRLSNGKRKGLQAVSDSRGIIAALAMDQRTALQSLMAKVSGTNPESIPAKMLTEFKEAVSRILTPHASAILLDPEYGLSAARQRARKAGLLLYAMDRKFGAEDSLKLAAACGTASCLSELPGQLSTTEVQRLRELVKIQVVS